MRELCSKLCVTDGRVGRRGPLPGRSRQSCAYSTVSSRVASSVSFKRCKVKNFKMKTIIITVSGEELFLPFSVVLRSTRTPANDLSGFN